MEKDDVLYLTNHDQFNLNLPKTLNEFRKDGRLCDVNLLVNGKCVKAHRIVLAARSAYFEAMFSGNFQESDNGVVDIDMSHSVAVFDHLEEVISALYEGSCRVTTANISGLYHLASFFMFEELKQSLIERLLSWTYSKLQNVVQSFILALTYGLSTLEEKCLTVIEARFHDHFIYQEDVLLLSVEQMKYLFQRKIHKYCSLLKIVVFLLKWIKQNINEKEEYESVSLALVKPIASQMTNKALTKIGIFLNSKRSDPVSQQFFRRVQDIIDITLQNQPRIVSQPASEYVEDLRNEVITGKTNCLILVAPGQEIIKNVCRTECEYVLNQRDGKRIHLFENIKGENPMKLVLYDMELNNWFDVGQFIPFRRFNNKNNWKAATANDQLYFVSVHQQICYSLCLKTLTCQEISIQSILNLFQAPVKSIIPLAVDGKLFVLASSCMAVHQPQLLECYVTHQKYFQLQTDLSWSLKGEIEHDHAYTPISLINVCDKKIIAIKANIVVSLGKNLLEIKDGHVFDSQTSTVNKFSAPCYVSSPVRLLVNGDTLSIVDGEGWKRQYDWTIKEWTFPEKTDLSLVRWCRSVSSSEDYSYPCLSHVAANAGDAIWEVANHGAFTNYLLKIDFDNDGDLQTTKHTPPPFRYFTLCTAGMCSIQLLQSLTDSQYNMEPDFQ